MTTQTESNAQALIEALESFNHALAHVGKVYGGYTMNVEVTDIESDAWGDGEVTGVDVKIGGNFPTPKLITMMSVTQRIIRDNTQLPHYIRAFTFTRNESLEVRDVYTLYFRTNPGF